MPKKQKPRTISVLDSRENDIAIYDFAGRDDQHMLWVERGAPEKAPINEHELVVRLLAMFARVK